MTEQFYQNNFSREGQSSINVDLVFMQIQALKKSLRRLTDKEDDLGADIPINGDIEAVENLDC